MNFNALSGGSKGEDGYKETERIITKCICKVLNGFHFDEVQDAIEAMEQEKNKDKDNEDMDLSDLMKKVMKEATPVD